MQKIYSIFKSLDICWAEFTIKNDPTVLSFLDLNNGRCLISSDDISTILTDENSEEVKTFSSDGTLLSISEGFREIGIKTAKFKFRHNEVDLGVVYQYIYLDESEFQLGRVGDIITNYFFTLDEKGEEANVSDQNATTKTEI